MKKLYKVTDKQFQQFKERCLFWQDKFGLGEWLLHFTHEKLEGKYAQTRWGINGRKATITLTIEFEIEELIGFNIEESACHEVLHVALAGMVTYTDQYNDDVVDQEEHILINHLLKGLLK